MKSLILGFLLNLLFQFLILLLNHGCGSRGSTDIRPLPMIYHTRLLNLFLHFVALMRYFRAIPSENVRPFFTQILEIFSNIHILHVFIITTSRNHWLILFIRQAIFKMFGHFRSEDIALTEFTHLENLFLFGSRN